MAVSPSTPSFLSWPNGFICPSHLSGGRRGPRGLAQEPPRHFRASSLDAETRRTGGRPTSLPGDTIIIISKQEGQERNP